MPLHLIKLSVGPRSLADLRSRQADAQPTLRHQTRHFPRRAAEILEGGSIYWVINSILVARQRILDITGGERQDGTRCTDLILHPALVEVRPQFRKPFQGWRYLPAAEAPPDEAAQTAHDTLPDRMRRDLAALGLL